MLSKQQGYLSPLGSPENLMFCAQWTLITSVGWALVNVTGLFSGGGDSLFSVLLPYIIFLFFYVLPNAFAQWLVLDTQSPEYQGLRFSVLCLLWVANIPIILWVGGIAEVVIRAIAGALTGFLIGATFKIVVVRRLEAIVSENLSKDQIKPTRLWKLVIATWVVVIMFLLSQIVFSILIHRGWVTILRTNNSREVPDVPQYPMPSAVDAQGRTWIVDNDRKLQGYAPDGAEKTFVLGSVNDIVIDEKGRVWIATDRGIYLLHSDGYMERYTPKNSGLPYIRTNNLVLDDQGYITIGSDNWKIGSGYRGAISRVDPDLILPVMNDESWLIFPSIVAVLTTIVFHAAGNRNTDE